jgi:hypothetical protein
VRRCGVASQAVYLLGAVAAVFFSLGFFDRYHYNFWSLEKYHYNSDISNHTITTSRTSDERHCIRSGMSWAQLQAYLTGSAAVWSIGYGPRR